MPSPIGHSIVGYLISRSEGTLRTPSRRMWILLVLTIFAANAPDLDYVPGLLAGNIKLYHHGMAHSLGFAVLFGAGMAFILKRCWDWRFWKGFFLFFMLYASHLVLDLFGHDQMHPLGLQLFWPLTNSYFISPITFFPGLANSSLSAMLSVDNFKKAGIEVLMLLPVIAVVFFKDRKR